MGIGDCLRQACESAEASAVAAAASAGSVRGIVSIVRTAGDGSEGTTDTYRITYTDASVTDYDVYNGADGANIDHVSRTVGDGSAGTTDTYTMWGDVGETISLGTFDIYNGVDGISILSGSVDPTTQGADDDLYLNVTSSDLFKKITGTWTLQTNIKGIQGDQGIQGVQGDQGIQGVQGDQGIQGIQGIAGVDGDTIDHITRTVGTGAPGTTDTYTVYGDLAETQILGTFDVYNGANGTGTVASIVGGTNVTIDNTDPANPIINATDTNTTYTDAEIKTKYENNTDTNAYTDTEKGKVGHIAVTQAVDLDAIETRVNELDAAIVLMGTWDASVGDFPDALNTTPALGVAIDAGMSWIVSTGGTVNGIEFVADDRLIAIVDAASNTVYAGNWHKADYTDLLKPDVANIFTAAQTFVGVVETKVAMAANDIAVSSGSVFTKTITVAATLTVSSLATSGKVNSFVLELINGGAAVVTWFAGIKWAGGTAPTLTTAGVDVLGFYTHDNGTTWRGHVMALDSK